jgi:tetratricopeptide (TPR) repeat protein
MSGDSWQLRAARCYDDATFGGRPERVVEGEDELDAIEADLALSRGKLLHARFLDSRTNRDGTHRDERELPLFERAVELYRKLDDRAKLADALFWVGCCHQVVLDDEATALDHFHAAYDLAAELGADLTRSFAVRHLGFAALNTGELDLAKTRFAESLRLRRDADAAPPVVAAAIIPLAVLADQRGDLKQADDLFAEATRIAEDNGAVGVLGWIEQARAVG